MLCNKQKTSLQFLKYFYRLFSISNYILYYKKMYILLHIQNFNIFLFWLFYSSIHQHQHHSKKKIIELPRQNLKTHISHPQTHTPLSTNKFQHLLQTFQFPYVRNINTTWQLHWAKSNWIATNMTHNLWIPILRIPVEAQPKIPFSKSSTFSRPMWPIIRHKPMKIDI